MTWRFYIYEHRRADTGAVFYVGKGTFRKNRKATYERANDTGGRSLFWRRVAAKSGGFSVAIVASCRSQEDACAAETTRIAYRRAECRLVNLTDGGDGRRNGVFSDTERKKRSENASRPRSRAWIGSIRRARKNGGNGGVVRRGDRLPQWWRDRISSAVTGSGNHMFGRRGAAHPLSKAVIDTATSIVYPSVSAAADAVGLRMKTLHNRLTGHRKNSTTLRFADAS